MSRQSGKVMEFIQGRPEQILGQKGEEMKRIAAVSMILLLMAGVVYAKNYEVTKKAGEYTVVAMIDKNPPVVGDNDVTVEIRDASGKVVTDARVKVEYSMPAMPGMPAMAYKTDATLKGTGYQAKMNFPWPARGMWL